jgi:hypothetical protein
VTNPVPTHGVADPGATPVIHIDRKRYDAPRRTLQGSELRALARPPIGADRDLWQEVPGGEDRLVEDDDAIAVTNGMHFYSSPATINPG